MTEERMQDRRKFLGAGATALAAAQLGTLELTQTVRAEPAGVSPTKDAIRPFRVKVPQADLDELRRRVAATRWPERETVADASQGVQLATTQRLARYWESEYDWRKVET